MRALGLALVAAGLGFAAVAFVGVGGDMRASATSEAACGCGPAAEGSLGEACLEDACAPECDSFDDALAASGQPTEEAAAPTPDPARNCGIVALHEVCSGLGVEASPEELARSAHAGSRGVTMLGLAEAARAKGLKATGIRLSYDDLESAKKPLIAWLQHGHFVVVREVTPERVMLSNGAGGETTTPRADFERKWRGEVLLVEKTAGK